MFEVTKSTPSPVRFANHLSPCPGERNRSRTRAAILQLGFLAPTKWGRGAEPTGLAFGKPEDRLRAAVRGCFGKKLRSLPRTCNKVRK